MPLRRLNFEILKARPGLEGVASIAKGKKYRAVLNGKAFKKGETVIVTYAGMDKVTFMATKVSLSMFPADFLNAFEEENS